MSSSPLNDSMATAPGASVMSSQSSTSDTDFPGSYPKDPRVALDQLNEKAVPTASESANSGTVMDAAREDLRNAVDLASKYLPESVMGAIGSVLPAGTTDTDAVQKNLDASHTPTAVAANSTLGGLGASDIAVAGIVSDTQPTKHDNLASSVPAAQIPLPPSSAAISSNSSANPGFDVKSDANAPLSPFSEGLSNTYAPTNFASTASLPGSSIPPSESIPPPGGAAELANIKGKGVQEGEKLYKPLAEVQASQASLGAADIPSEPQHTAPAVAAALDSTAPGNAGEDVHLAAATLAGTRSPAPINFASTVSLNSTQAFAGDLDSNAPTPAAVPESTSTKVGEEAQYVGASAGVGAAATAYEHEGDHGKAFAGDFDSHASTPAAVTDSKSTKVGEEAPYVAAAAGVGAAATAYEHGHGHENDATPTASLAQVNENKPATAVVEDAKQAQDAEKEVAKEAKAAEKDDKKAEKAAAKEVKAAEKSEKKAEKEEKKSADAAAASEAARRKEQLEREKEEKRRDQEAAAAALAADKERQKEAKEKVKEEKKEEKEAKKEEKAEKKQEKQLEKEEKKEEKHAAKEEKEAKKEEKKEEKQSAAEEKKGNKVAAAETTGALGAAGVAEHQQERERASDTAPGTPPINPARPDPPRSGVDSDFPLESPNASLASGIHAIDLDGTGTGADTGTDIAAGGDSRITTAPTPIEKEKEAKPYHGPEGLSEKQPGGALPSNAISSESKASQRSETNSSVDNQGEPKKEGRVKHFMDKVKDKLHHSN